MLQDKLQKYFTKNPDLRILFFFDKDSEYEEEIGQIQLSNVRIIKFDGRWFFWKIELNKVSEEKVCLYFNQASPETQEQMLDFPLLDLLKANKELRLDDVAEFMDEYNLQPHQQFIVIRYMEELSKIKIQKNLKPVLNAANFDEKSVKQGLISAFLDLHKIEDWTTILVRLLSYAHPDKQANLSRFFTSILKYNLLDTLNQQIRQIFDTTVACRDREEIAGLIRMLKYNAITQNLIAVPVDPYKEIKIKDSTCFNSLNQVLDTGLKHNTMSKMFFETLQKQGASIQPEKIIAVYGFDADYVYNPDDLVGEIIKVIINNDSEQADSRLKFLYTRINDEGSIQRVLTFLYHVSLMKSLIKEAGNALWDTPEEYIERYTKTIYKIDFNYRKAVFEYRQMDLQSTPVEEQLNDIKQKMDKSYYDFGFKLNDGWLKRLNEIGFDYSKIGCDKQMHFYTNYVVQKKQKRVIIISDALRYEVGDELLKELHRDDKNVSVLNFQLASIPSKTSVGMANLLPGEIGSFRDDGIYIDHEKTTLVEQREKVLQKASVNSKAVHYDTIINNNKQQNRELFKSDIVYVYHNVIDNEGHHGTERNTFMAVRTAIEELAKLVKLILGGFGVSNVIVTADHGFLYNDMDISATDKNEMQDTDIIQSDARHYITPDHQPVAYGYKFSLFQTTSFHEPFSVVIPDSINRFKKQGSRYMFTHGGGSLQELIVPVIKSIRKEERIQRKVKPALLDKNLSIVSNSFRFQLIQEKAISATEKERTLLIGIYDNEYLVSKEERLLLNATGELPTERVYTVSLVLVKKPAGSILKLRIIDEEDRLNPLIEENIKNNTLIGRDF